MSSNSHDAIGAFERIQPIGDQKDHRTDRRNQANGNRKQDRPRTRSSGRFFLFILFLAARHLQLESQLCSDAAVRRFPAGFIVFIKFFDSISRSDVDNMTLNSLTCDSVRLREESSRATLLSNSIWRSRVPLDSLSARTCDARVASSGVFS